MRARLIDYGISQKYQDLNGDHIKETHNGRFFGSLWFTSQHVMEMKPRTRRDDLISLAYLMLFLMEELPFARFNDSVPFAEKYYKVLE